MIKLLIFDFDGVIADTMEVAVKTVNIMAEKEGYEGRVKASEIRELGLHGLIKKYRVPLHKVLGHIHHSREIIKQNIASVKVFPGIKGTLAKLKKGRKLALVTSNSHDNVMHILRRNKIENIFDIILAGVSIFGKAGMMSKAVSKAGVKKEDAICIGDEERDIAAARKAGLKVVAVTWGFNSEKLLRKQGTGNIARTQGQLISRVRELDRKEA